MRRGDVLYQSCVEPESRHTEGTADIHFPPFIAQCNIQGSGSDAIEHQLWRNWKSYPANVKEDIVLEDLINVLCGSDGTLFSIDKSSYMVKISTILDTHNDSTLHMMATEILELAIMQRKVQDFVYTNEQGFVALTVCEVMSLLLQELQSRILQFEDSHTNGSLGIQRLKLYIQPALHTFEVLSMITSRGDMTGAALINMLSSVNGLYGTGDTRRGLVLHLMKQAVEAYCCLIDPWIHFGELHDPCQEFFVVPKRADVVQREPRDFMIEWVRVPEMMKDIAQTVLDTGYYVRILASSKRTVCFESHQLKAVNVEELREGVMTVNNIVTGELMKHIVFDCNFVDVLVSLHRFFLTSRGDYISILLADISNHDLHESINARFQEAVSQSSLCNEPYRNNYSMRLEKEPTSIESFMGNRLEDGKIMMLDFKVEWPLLMILNDMVMSKYKLVFGFLLQLKKTSSALSTIWLSHMKWKRLPLIPTSQLRLNFTFVSIERMLYLCRNMEYLCTIEVAERNFNLMLRAYEACIKNQNGQQAFNGLAKEHEQFIGKVVENCMLDDKAVFPFVQRALSLCDVFASQVLTFLKQWEAESYRYVKPTGNYSLERETKFTSELLQNPGYIAMVGTAASQFDKHLSALVTVLEGTEEHKRGSLLLRLNFNGFFG